MRTKMELSLFAVMLVYVHAYGIHHESAKPSCDSNGATIVTKPPRRPLQPFVPPPLALTTSTSPPLTSAEVQQQTQWNSRHDPDGDSIVGRAGHDYPILSRVPLTSFNCSHFGQYGYYVDAEANCQVFHVCFESGGHVSFLCPNGTMFNQKYLVCDWWYNVDCRPVQSNLTVAGDSSLSPLTVTTTDVSQQDSTNETTVEDDVTSTVDSLNITEHLLFSQSHM